MELVTQVGRIVVAAVLVFVLGFAYATVSPVPTSASGGCDSDYCHDMPGRGPSDESCGGSVCDTRGQICCYPEIVVFVPRS